MITEKERDKKGNRYYSVLVESTENPVTVEEVKEFARIDGNDEDLFIENVINAVTKLVENYLNRSLVIKTMQMITDEINSKEIEIPYSPLQSVLSVNLIDEENNIIEIDKNNYYVITESIPGRLVFKRTINIYNNLRDYAGYKIIFECGYGDKTKVPKQIKLAIMQWVTMIYENRSMTGNELMKSDIPDEILKILKQFRVLRI